MSRFAVLLLTLQVIGPIPMLGGQARPVLPGSWSDPSPHKVLFIEVEPGVRLEVLDWGGTGEPVFLLAGHGNTAHVFDNFAPELARSYHVFALTRRGFGASSQPKDGYNLPRLIEDIVSVEDGLKVRKVNLVGHSIAGDEMNGFALRFPGRVRKLVYLEAAYDRRVAAVASHISASANFQWPKCRRSFFARSAHGVFKKNRMSRTSGIRSQSHKNFRRRRAF